MNFRLPIAFLAATLIVGCSHNREKEEENETVVTMDQVPPAARDALKREAQGAAIGKIDKEMSGGKEVYETDVMINGKNWEIKVDAAGNVISKKIDNEENEKNEKKSR
jgi:uncharacterized membrane protein YkoI